ncbi:hypothetical protein BHE74_00021127 [Ensete ventricosum]|nr:hypothetical protein GW17_00029017 [Ensete ventricosum]RWW71146.1 hypothetical protein BHE74_00021127 [Ensete ventricosum]
MYVDDNLPCMQFLIRTLKKLKCENDMAALTNSNIFDPSQMMLSNSPTVVNSNVEVNDLELQQEIGRYQQQLQLSEQRLRLSTTPNYGRGHRNPKHLFFFCLLG